MISERKRKWILGTLLAILVITPIATLNNYTLDRVQRNIKAGVDAQKVEPWMPVWQSRIAHIYRYTMRDESAAKAFQQYFELFYLQDRDGANQQDGVERAESAVWDYAQVLEELNRRNDAYLYYYEIVQAWPNHPHRQQAEVREHDLKKMGHGN